MKRASRGQLAPRVSHLRTPLKVNVLTQGVNERIQVCTQGPQFNPRAHSSIPGVTVPPQGSQFHPRGHCSTPGVTVPPKGSQFNPRDHSSISGAKVHPVERNISALEGKSSQAIDKQPL
jgi:hypothetical protein